LKGRDFGPAVCAETRSTILSRAPCGFIARGVDEGPRLLPESELPTDPRVIFDRIFARTRSGLAIIPQIRIPIAPVRINEPLRSPPAALHL